MHFSQFRKPLIFVPVVGLALAFSVVGDPQYRPSWWAEGDHPVILEDAIPNNRGPANIGQAKWMTTRAYEELVSTIPGGLSFTLTDLFPAKPLAPDASWSAAQKGALNLGQLKALAKPFYDALNEISPDWVLAQIQRNHDNSAIPGTHYWQTTGRPLYIDGGYYPWNPDTPIEENNQLAMIGQLKAVFSLDFKSDADSNGRSDLLDHIGSEAGNSVDTDGDGLSDEDEALRGTNPNMADTDGDSIRDGDEIASGHDPLSNQSFPPRLISTTKYGWSSDTPSRVYAAWDPTLSTEVWPDSISDMLETSAGMPFPVTVSAGPWPNEEFSFGSTTAFLYRDNPGDLDQGIIRQTRVWLETKPAATVAAKKTLLKLGRQYDLNGEIIGTQVEATALTIPVGSTLSAALDLLPDIETLPIGPGVTTELSLLPVEVVELAPKLRDESDVEIVSSEKPAVAPKSTEMVERDPSATPTPLNDASAIRIAWRDMKVKIGAPMTGKKVTWSMTPQFTPLQSDGTPEAAPRFRGKWGTAANTVHRHRFSASEKYGVNGYKSIAQILETETSTNVTTVAQTTIDAKGYTAIRVNLPPIGFNKARIKIQIEGTEGEIDLIDLEVPAVVVIDPGHGGSEEDPNPGGSAWNHATSATGVLEKDMTLALALKMKSRFSSLKNEGSKIKLVMTRNANNNLSASSRSSKSYLNGADVFVSLHFNGGSSSIRGSEVWIYPNEPPPSGFTSAYNSLYQINYNQDHALAQRLLNTCVGLIGSGTHGDGINGYDLDHETMYAKTPANVYQDNATYLRNLPVPGIDSSLLSLSRAALVEVAYISNPTDDAWFNGVEGENNTTRLANGLVNAIINDINIQP